MGRTARSPHGFTRREALRVLSATSMALPAGVPPARPPLGELGSHHSPLRRGSGRIPSSSGRHKRHRVGADRLRQSGFLRMLQGASEIRQRGLGKLCNRANPPLYPARRAKVRRGLGPSAFPRRWQGRSEAYAHTGREGRRFSRSRRGKCPSRVRSRSQKKRCPREVRPNFGLRPRA